jgi:hypothetical protein
MDDLLVFNVFQLVFVLAFISTIVSLFCSGISFFTGQFHHTRFFLLDRFSADFFMEQLYKLTCHGIALAQYSRACSGLGPPTCQRCELG